MGDDTPRDTGRDPEVRQPPIVMVRMPNDPPAAASGGSPLRIPPMQLLGSTPHDWLNTTFVAAIAALYVWQCFQEGRV